MHVRAKTVTMLLDFGPLMKLFCPRGVLKVCARAQICMHDMVLADLQTKLSGNIAASCKISGGGVHAFDHSSVICVCLFSIAWASSTATRSEDKLVLFLDCLVVATVAVAAAAAVPLRACQCWISATLNRIAHESLALEARNSAFKLPPPPLQRGALEARQWTSYKQR